MQGDGNDPLTVATSVGMVSLPRQVWYDPVQEQHCLPANAWLPEHGGILITRRLQEWACLLGCEFAFAIAQRLLGWQAGEERLLSESEVQRLVCRHGQVLREAAAAEVATWLGRAEAGEGVAQWVEHQAPRRKAAWAKALNEAVAEALLADPPTPPEGVTLSDWERVLAHRRTEIQAPSADPDADPDADPGQSMQPALGVSALARLGPEVRPGEVQVSADEVLVRALTKGEFLELRTARVTTAAGYRYLCGSGPLFVQQLWLLILLSGGARGLVTFLSDGAVWLKEFVREWLGRLERVEVILDWYHLVKKCRDRISRMGGSREEKQTLKQAMLRALWGGKLDQALAHLQQYRQTAQHLKPLEELQGYLESRRASLPHYRERRTKQQYIGSGHAEKANDLLVARRQKNRGMHFSLPTSEALARLKLLQLNHEWDAYWTDGRLPSMVAQ